MAGLGRQLAPILPLPFARAMAAILVGLAVLFLVVANPATIRTATYLADLQVPGEQPDPDWPAAKPTLEPLVARVPIVVTTEELGRSISSAASMCASAPRSCASSMARTVRRRPADGPGRDLDPRGPAAHPPMLPGRAACPRQALEPRAHPGPDRPPTNPKQHPAVPLPGRTHILAYTWQQPAGAARPAECSTIPPMPGPAARVRGPARQRSTGPGSPGLTRRRARVQARLPQTRRWAGLQARACVDNQDPMYLYVIGRGHSGSTILDILVGGSAAGESLGELTSGFKHYETGGHCACGSLVRECPFWAEVRRRFEALGYDWVAFCRAVGGDERGALAQHPAAGADHPECRQLATQTQAFARAVAEASGKPHLLIRTRRRRAGCSCSATCPKHGSSTSCGTRAGCCAVTTGGWQSAATSVSWTACTARVRWGRLACGGRAVLDGRQHAVRGREARSSTRVLSSATRT